MPARSPSSTIFFRRLETVPIPAYGSIPGWDLSHWAVRGAFLHLSAYFILFLSGTLIASLPHQPWIRSCILP